MNKSVHPTLNHPDVVCGMDRDGCSSGQMNKCSAISNHPDVVSGMEGGIVVAQRMDK